MSLGFTLIALAQFVLLIAFYFQTKYIQSLESDVIQILDVMSKQAHRIYLCEDKLVTLSNTLDRSISHIQKEIKK